MTSDDEQRRKQYDNWNRYYQKHKSEINARRKKVREDYKNKLSIAEKRIKELKNEVELWKKASENNSYKAFQLQKENAELKGELKSKDSIIADIDESEGYLVHENQELDDQLTKAKELIENIIRVTWGEGWNYSLDWKVKAEQFLKEVEDGN